MLPFFVRSLLLPLSLLCVVGCGGSDDPPPPVPEAKVEPTLSDIQAKIFTPTCSTQVGCHGLDNKVPGVYLTEGLSRKSLVNAKGDEDPTKILVVPGKPESSLLYTLLSAKDGMTPVMPKGLGQLSAARKEVIRQWIANGANDD